MSDIKQDDGHHTSGNPYYKSHAALTTVNVPLGANPWQNE